MVHRGQNTNSRRPEGILADAGKLQPGPGMARDAARVFVLRVPMRGLQGRTETIPERKRVGALLAMTDWTARAIELEEAKAAMLAAKKRIKSEVEREALRKARETVADRVAEVEYDFARRLAMAVAEGMPQDTIRKEVLRTNDWPTWRKWRDMAQIEPQRVSVAKAKEVTRQANRGFRWEEDPTAEIGWVFVLDRDEKGNPVPEIRIDSWIVKDDRLQAFPNNDDETRAYAGKYFGDLHGLARFVTRLATETREEIGR